MRHPKSLRPRRLLEKVAAALLFKPLRGGLCGGSIGCTQVLKKCKGGGGSLLLVDKHTSAICANKTY